MGLSLGQLVSHVVAETEGMAGADLAYLCQGAKLAAMEAAGFRGEPRLRLADFDGALPEFSAPK